MVTVYLDGSFFKIAMTKNSTTMILVQNKKTKLGQYFSSQGITINPTEWNNDWNVAASPNLCLDANNNTNPFCNSYAEFFVSEMQNGYNAYEDYVEDKNNPARAQIIGRLIREYKKNNAGIWEARIKNPVRNQCTATARQISKPVPTFQMALMASLISLAI